MIMTQMHEASNPTPAEIGQRDAECGLLCVPEMYFVRRDQMIDYVRGHASVATSLLAEQLLSRWNITMEVA